jgi:hypothetical protein
LGQPLNKTYVLSVWSFAVVLGSSFLMLIQAYNHELPTYVYLCAVVFSVIGVSFCILYATELIAISNVLIFSLTIRIMYYISTRFLVFPFGDPYQQFNVLQAFAKTSHPEILQSILPFATVTTIQPIVYQYSQWPGLEVLTLEFARTTNIPLLQAAIILSLFLYLVLFFVSYALVKRILNRFVPSMPNLSVLCMAIWMSFPTSEIPPVFKYDLLATILLLGSVVLLLLDNKFDFKISLTLVILGLGIVIIHSITALVWIALLFLITTLSGLKSIISLKTGRSERNRQTKDRLHYGIGLLLIFVAVATISWWTYYATFMLSYLHATIPKLAHSVSFFALSFTHQSPNSQIYLSRLTPGWISTVLVLRNAVLVTLLVLGTLIILFRPSILKNFLLITMLLGIASITLLTVVIPAINLGDRAFLLFGPLLGVVVTIPFLLLEGLSKISARITAIVTCILLLLSAGIGFWGGSYAPVELYQQGSSVSLAGARPTGWTSVADYLNHSEKPTCIVSNEIYVTSLSVSISLWNVTNLIGNNRIGPDCIAIVYWNLEFNEFQNISSLGFGEPLHPYSGLKKSESYNSTVFYNLLETRTDSVFDSGFSAIYYYP